MTYQELLAELHKAERFTEELEAAVNATTAKNLASYGADYIAEHGEADKFDAAQSFIWDMEQKSWEDTDDYGTQNAYDTVADYGVDFNSLVGQFIFANSNNPAGV
tara:strand:- start:110 stop:424 length:315 start_codon:yes stop_codon:yes gene_type:complete